MRNFLVCLLLLLPASASADDVLLSKAVEKLIIDVHNLKLQVLKLQQEIKELKAKRNTEPNTNKPISKKAIRKQIAKHNNTKIKNSPNCSFTVVRGEVKKSPTSCLLATVKRVRRKGVENLLSSLPPEVPLYVKRYGKYCVYLTLPEYCSKVKERVKDATVVHISIPASQSDDGSR